MFVLCVRLLFCHSLLFSLDMTAAAFVMHRLLPIYRLVAFNSDVMRVRARPGWLASFGLRVSSDCDAGSLARGVRRYCCRLVFFMRHHLRFEIRVVLLLDPQHVSPGAARCSVSDPIFFEHSHARR